MKLIKSHATYVLLLTVFVISVFVLFGCGGDHEHASDKYKINKDKLTTSLDSLEKSSIRLNNSMDEYKQSQIKLSESQKKLGNAIRFLDSNLKYYSIAAGYERRRDQMGIIYLRTGEDKYRVLANKYDSKRVAAAKKCNRYSDSIKQQ
jgi:exonuclease VII small subunit